MNSVKSYKFQFKNENIKNEFFSNFKTLCEFDENNYNSLSEIGYYSGILLDKNAESFSLLDKFVYEIAYRHGKENGINIKDEDVYVEFWKRDNTSGLNNLHYDKDETFKQNKSNYLKCTELTILSYFDESKQPIIITNNIKGEIYDNKTIYVKNSEYSKPMISVIFPEKESQIVFNGGKYFHVAANIFNLNNEIRRTLVVNIFRFTKQELQNQNCFVNFWYTNNLQKQKEIAFSKYSTYINSYKNYILQNDLIKIVNKNLLQDHLIKIVNKDLNLNLMIDNEKTVIDTFLNKKEFNFNLLNFLKQQNTELFNNRYLITEPIHKFNYTDNYNFILLSVSTDQNNKGYQRFLSSVKQNKLNYKILGLNETWNGGNMKEGCGGGQKINLLKKELSEYSEEKLSKTIIMFTDSYDVIITGNQNEILERYFKSQIYYERPNSIMFSAEKFCWPDPNKKEYYPENYSVYKYLNSGSFIGRGYDIFNLIEKYTYSDSYDDQLFYTNQFLNNKDWHEIYLDYECMLFQTLNEAYCDLKIESNMFKNVFFNTYPLIIHGNGNSQVKHFFESLCYYYNNKYSFLENSFFNIYIKNTYEKEINIPVLAICLPDRLEQIKEEVKKEKFNNVKFMQAVDGRTDLNKYNFKIHKNIYKCKYIDHTLREGEIGAFLSHYNLWCYIVSENIEVALIIEDDIIFNTNFNYELTKLLKYIPTQEYDLLNLDPFYQNVVNFENNLKYYKEGIFEGGFAYNTTGYLLTFEGAKKLIQPDCLNNMMAVDDYTNVVAKTHPSYQSLEIGDNKDTFKILSFYSSICHQRGNEYSIIEKTELYEK